MKKKPRYRKTHRLYKAKENSRTYYVCAECHKEFKCNSEGLCIEPLGFCPKAPGYIATLDTPRGKEERIRQVLKELEK